MMASTLFLLLLGVVTRIILPLFGYFRWTSARAELLQAAALISRYVVGDLQRAPLEGVQLAASDLFSIHGIEDVSDTGRAVWSPHLIVYGCKQGTLTRVLAPADVSRPVKPPLGALNAFLLDTHLPHRTLVRGLLKEFELSFSGTHGLPLKLRLTVSLDVPGRPPQTYEHLQTIQLRNGGG